MWLIRIDECRHGFLNAGFATRLPQLSFFFPYTRFILPSQENGRPRRAPHEDLSGYTAEQRVARWRERARKYSNSARQRVEQLLQELKEDVDSMRIYNIIMEEAPHMVTVLSMDIHCLVLYANKAFERVLGHMPDELVGRYERK